MHSNHNTTFEHNGVCQERCQLYVQPPRRFQCSELTFLADVGDKASEVTSGSSKEANKNVAKDSDASLGTRASAAKDAASDKIDETKNSVCSIEKIPQYKCADHIHRRPLRATSRLLSTKCLNIEAQLLRLEVLWLH